jgi:hypothetical protein
MVYSNDGNNTDNNGKDVDKVGKLYNGLLCLLEEDDEKGNVCYCVESVSNDELLYSSHSKPQAFSYCEGYRAANGEGATKPRKAKDGSSPDDSSPEDKSNPPKTVDPAKVQRKRIVF